MEAQKVLFIKYGSDEKNEGLWTEQKRIWDFTFMGFVHSRKLFFVHSAHVK